MTTRKNIKSNAAKFLEKVIGEKLTLGLLLKSIREGEEKTLAEFALILGTTRQNLCDYEKSRKLLSLSKAAEYADILGYSRQRFVALCLQDLIDREGLNMKVNLEAA